MRCRGEFSSEQRGRGTRRILAIDRRAVSDSKNLPPGSIKKNCQRSGFSQFRETASFRRNLLADATARYIEASKFIEESENESFETTVKILNVERNARQTIRKKQKEKSRVNQDPSLTMSSKAKKSFDAIIKF